MREQLLLRTPDEPFFAIQKMDAHFQEAGKCVCCASPSFAYFFSGQTSFFTTSKVKFLHHVGKKATQNSFSSKYLLEKKHALVLHILLISSLTQPTYWLSSFVAFPQAYFIYVREKFGHSFSTIVMRFFAKRFVNVTPHKEKSKISQQILK